MSLQKDNDWRARQAYLRATYAPGLQGKAHERAAKTLDAKLGLATERYLRAMSLWELDRRVRDGTVTPVGTRSLRIPGPMIEEAQVALEDLPQPPPAPVTRSSLTAYNYGQSRRNVDAAQNVVWAVQLARAGGEDPS